MSITRYKIKYAYIVIAGAVLPIRIGTGRKINLTNYLSEYQKSTQMFDLTKFFEDFWNELYTGYDGYTTEETDL